MGMPSEIGKHILPIYKFLYDDVRDFYFDYYGRKYYPRFIDDIKFLKDILKGERCFIWGSGPSLKKTNIDLLKDEINFGSNTLANHPKADYFSYFSCYDWLAWCDVRKNALKLDAGIFLGGKAGQKYLSQKRWHDKKTKGIITPIKRRGGFEDFNINYDFNINLFKGAWHDASVIGFNIQLAYWMGFDPIYLIGMDCDYSQGRWNTKSQTDHNRFFGCQTVNTTSLIRSMEKIRKIFDREKRNIINCTVGGKLEAFKRKDLEEVL